MGRQRGQHAVGPYWRQSLVSCHSHCAERISRTTCRDGERRRSYRHRLVHGHDGIYNNTDAHSSRYCRSDFDTDKLTHTDGEPYDDSVTDSRPSECR